MSESLLIFPASPQLCSCLAVGLAQGEGGGASCAEGNLLLLPTLRQASVEVQALPAFLQAAPPEREIAPELDV